MKKEQSLAIPLTVDDDEEMSVDGIHIPTTVLLGKPISGAIVTLYVLQGVNYIFPFLTFPYLTRTLGLSGFGQTQMILAYAAIGGIFTDWGFNFSATHAIARARNSREKLSQIAMNTLSAKLVLFVLWMPLGLLIDVLFEQSRVSMTIYFLAIFVVFSSTITPNWLYQGVERFREASVSAALVRAVTTCLIFLLVRSPADIFVVVALNGINGIVVSSWLWARIFYARDITFCTPRVLSMVEALREGAEVFITQLVIVSYTTGAVLVAGLLGGPHAAGAYAVVERLMAACKAVLSPVVQVIYVRISAFHHLTQHEFFAVTLKPFLMLLGLVSGLVMLILLEEKFIFERILHVSLAEVRGVVFLLALTLPVLVLAHWIVTVGLLARGLRRKWMVAIFVGPIIGLALPFMLLGRMSPQNLVALLVLSIEAMILVVGYSAWKRSWQ